MEIKYQDLYKTMKKVLFIIVILFGSCQNEPTPVPSSNQEMATLLAQITEDITPQYPYFNSLRADKQAVMLEGIGYNVVIDRRYKYADQLLQAGKIQDCILEIEKLLANAFNDPSVNPKSKPYYELLALAYLRLGEQDNCLTNRTAASCIIPIAESAVHTDRRGSEMAIEIYKKLLAANPKDYQSMWLMNLAYMTLGQYPEVVPSAFLIPPSAFESDYPLPKFNDIAMSKGVDVVGHAGGSIMEDFDNDGDLDLFMTGYIINEQAHYFENQLTETGTLSFKNKTEQAGLLGLTGGLNCIQADFDNDGWVDILVLRGGWLQNVGRIPNSLLKNNGDPDGTGQVTFTDVTKSVGMLTLFPTQTAVFLDVNLDGWLDIFVGNENYPSELYLNHGDLEGTGQITFSNIAADIGLDFTAFVKGAAMGDFNNDGKPDLYISVLNNKNKLFINTSTDEKVAFEEVAQQAGVHSPTYSFPCWVWDYNHDGLDDIFVSGYRPTRKDQVSADVAADYLNIPHKAELPRLYKNNGDLTFTDVSKEVSLHHPLFTMGCNFGDVDNDGWLDFYLSTGELNLWAAIPNLMYRNAGGSHFQNVTTSGGFGQSQKGHGVSFGDIDNDGDQDIYAVIGGASEGDFYNNMLFENPGNDNHYLILDFNTDKGNRSAIGAKVELTLKMPTGELMKRYYTVTSGSSFGANSLQLEIGLGQAESIEAAVVHWANRKRTKQDLGQLEMDKRYLVN